MGNVSDFTTEVIDNVFIVTINFHKATMENAGILDKLLSNEIDKGRNKLIIELHQVEFVDSTFLGALVINLKKLVAVNGKLILVGLKPSVCSVILQTNLSRTFEIFSSTKEALKNI
jgi:anti-sigma B factor antagonist